MLFQFLLLVDWMVVLLISYLKILLVTWTPRYVRVPVLVMLAEFSWFRGKNSFEFAAIFNPILMLRGVVLTANF